MGARVPLGCKTRIFHNISIPTRYAIVLCAHKDSKEVWSQWVILVHEKHLACARMGDNVTDVCVYFLSSDLMTQELSFFVSARNRCNIWYVATFVLLAS